MLLVVIILTSVFLDVSVSSEPLKVCSFNVQVFGANKSRNANVMRILGKIFSKYDLCLMQEIRDTRNSSITALLKQINGNTDKYNVVVSNRLGRSSSKEQYAFFYNKRKINVTDSFHFDDQRYGDLFEREPFIVRFAARNAPVQDFFVVSIHTTPAKAEQEIGHLVKAYDDASRRFNIQDGIIMGDFNAGCSYVPAKAWRSNPLRQDTRFTWFIGDDADTTVGKSRCAYDRAVVAGNDLPKRIKKASTFYYDAEWNVTLDMARLVSDHYPIEFTIEQRSVSTSNRFRKAYDSAPVLLSLMSLSGKL